MPFGEVSSFNPMNISACFTDNTVGNAGTFHADGASAKVVIDGKTYNISYKL